MNTFLPPLVIILLIGLLVWTMHMSFCCVCETFNSIITCKNSERECTRISREDAVEAERFTKIAKAFRLLMWSNIALHVLSWVIFGIDCWLLCKLYEILITVIL